MKSVAVVLLSLVSLYAQGLTGQLSGNITDSSGGVIVGAKIRIVSNETGQS